MRDFLNGTTRILFHAGLKLLAIHQVARTEGIYPRSRRVALAVGTLLNLINQPEALLGNAPWNLTQAVLTYAVPFLVATYGAAANSAKPSGQTG
jgi:hypothetical protein